MSVRNFALLLLALPLAACGGDDKVADAPKGDRLDADQAVAAEHTGTAPRPEPAAPASEPWRGVQPRVYAAGPVRLRFDSDGGFRISEATGSRKVEGRYVYKDDLLTLSDAKGDVGNARFPLRCRVAPAGAGFSLSAVAGSCTVFDHVSFEPAG